MEKIKEFVCLFLGGLLLVAIISLCGASDYEDAQLHAQHPNYSKYEQALLR